MIDYSRNGDPIFAPDKFAGAAISAVLADVFLRVEFDLPVKGSPE
ncbi:hypothetical protein GGQ61_004166 [Phenylobacterium haematophilum]|uniref:Uncharacterized protein n=1 Tax=Phenylobacterium haematophilum TaxID=98513 RepID=A0A840A7W7_9CAUL|nr:hypothetical protein [Phenylobacterium haematophilum]